GRRPADHPAGAPPLPRPPETVHRGDHAGRSEGVRSGAVLLALALLLGAPRAQAQEPLLFDGFDDPALWKAAPADGVAMKLSPATGRNGASLRFDFDFQGHAGYAIARRELPPGQAIDLPENYELAFQLRADPQGALINTLEVKLVDPSGQNVWWRNQRNF